MIKPRFLFVMSSFLFVSTIVVANDITQIDRYSTVSNQATAAQINPLLAVSQFKFPASIKTIGDAVRMVLDNSSYQLVEDNHLSSIVKQTLAKSLPISDRELGPLTISDAVKILMGKEVFNMVVDPLHRVVNFEVKPMLALQMKVNHARNS